MLEQERTYYSEHLDELLAQYPGRFVLVHDSELIGTFDTLEEALAEGARRFGLAPFLVRRVEREQPEASVPALMFGVLSADLPHTVSGPGKGAGR